MAFLPHDEAQRDEVKAGIAQLAAEESLTVLGWREVPVEPGVIGSLARAAMPAFEQLFIASTRTEDKGAPVGGLALERQAFRLRKRAERDLHVYFPSLSCRTLVYKGMVTTLQLEPFYPDLSDERFASRLGPRPLPVLHEHVPVVAARAAVPAHLAQRRDQHHRGQPQLDARPPVTARVLGAG